MTALRQCGREGRFADAGIAGYEQAVPISLQARAVERDDAHGGPENTNRDGDEQGPPERIVPGGLHGEHSPCMFLEQIVSNKTARR